MKTNKIAALLVSQLFQNKTLDDSAETVDEILASAPGQGHGSVRKRLREMVAKGSVEKVWKRVGKQCIPAYRVKAIA